MVATWRRRSVLALSGAMLIGAAGCATSGGGGDAGPFPAVEHAPGQPNLLLGMYPLSALGYRSDEYFLSGTATSYARNASGAVAASTTAPYATRIVVTRPEDASRFNGAVVVEWSNVSGGQDVPTDWLVAHRELARSGYVHVAVSAQIVGVEGGPSLAGPGNPLKRANPERYGRLSHPGDAYAFDIFSQAGRVLRGPDAQTVLGGLTPQLLLAAGESQSAHFLTTYVNAIDPIARVYDGFLVHSRFGGGAPLDGASLIAAPADTPMEAQPFRSDLRVPVLVVLTETDITDSRRSGYAHARVPDNAKLRAWEIAGAAHADNYLFGVGLMDTGALPIERLAQGFAPSRNAAGGQLALPANPGLPHHYVMQAAFMQLDRWVRTGQAPPSAPQLNLASATSFEVDANGIATGGLRTPWVDVPTVRMSGLGNSGGAVGFLAGVGEPFDAAKLAQLYPGGRADYLRRFEASLDASIAAGFILQADRAEILGIAGALWAGAS